MMSNWKKMPVHPLAAMFPRPTEIEHVALVQDMKERGYDKDHPIYTVDGAIIDGISRRDAAVEAGVEPTFKEHKSNDLLGFVIARNLHRRHLTTSQRQMLAVDIANIGKESNLQDSVGRTPYTEAALSVNVSERGARDAASVQRDAVPEVVDAVRNGTVTVTDAKQIKDETPAVQRAAVKDVKDGKANTATEAAAKRQPILCARCTRIGTATKGCEACKEARAAAKAEAKKPPPASDADESVMTDAEGETVPEQAREAFLRADDLTKICRELDDIRKRVEAIAKGPGGRLIRFEDIKQKLLDTKGNLWANRATHVCGYCHGKDKKCVACNGEGWTNKMNWTSAPGNDPKAKAK